MVRTIRELVEPTILHANDVDLCVQTFGRPGDAALILIGGATSSMDWWRTELCRRLAAAGHFVVRYDLRDTGASTSYPPGSPGYGQPDLADDLVAMADEIGLDRYHLVGISMGGGIAQRVALDHPGRVVSLTLMSTSPGGPDNPDLPPMSGQLMAAMSSPPPDPDWNDTNAVIEHVVAGQHAFWGDVHADPEELRSLLSKIIDRSTGNLQSQFTHHWSIDGGEPVRARLGTITVPTLVVHGSQDPLFPPGHAEVLAREVPGARLIVLDGLGHEVAPPVFWPQLIDLISQHTSEVRQPD